MVLLASAEGLDNRGFFDIQEKTELFSHQGTKPQRRDEYKLNKWLF